MSSRYGRVSCVDSGACTDDSRTTPYNIDIREESDDDVADASSQLPPRHIAPPPPTSTVPVQHQSPVTVESYDYARWTTASQSSEVPRTMYSSSNQIKFISLKNGMNIITVETRNSSGDEIAKRDLMI